MTLRRTLVAFLAVAMLVACGGGGGSSASSSSSTSSSSGRTPEQLAADQQTAQSVVLQLSDFPSGWTSKPRGPSTADTPEAIAATKQFAGCLGVDPSLVSDQSDPAKASSKSDKFTDGHNLEVEGSATVQASVDNKQELLAAFRKPASQACFEDFINTAFMYALAHPAPGKELPPGVDIGKVAVTPGNLPGVHGEPIVYRTTVPFTVQQQTITIVVDFVFVLKGRTSLDLTFQNVGAPFPTDLAVQLANTSIDRAPDT